jgi:hypothetical protein
LSYFEMPIERHLAFCLLLALTSVDAKRPADLTPIGAVLTGVGDGDRSRPFVDLVKQSRPFSSANNPVSA